LAMQEPVKPFIPPEARSVLFFLTIALWLASPSATLAQQGGSPGPGNNGMLLLGLRGLDPDFWSPVHDHAAASVEYDFPSQITGVNYLVGMSVSWDRRSQVEVIQNRPITLDFEGRVSELILGLRKYFVVTDAFQFYANAGASLFSVEAKAGSQWTGEVSASDAGGGLFLGGGSLVNLNGFLMGIDVRLMGGTEVGLWDAKGKADYIQTAFFMGMRF